MVVQLVATAGVTWLIVDLLGVGLEDALAIRSALPEVRAVPLAGSVFLLLGGFVVSALLWGRMVGALGGRSPGPVESSRIVFTANLARYLPGKVWQIAGLAVLSRRVGISATVATTAGVLGQTFSLAAAGVIAVPALLGLAGETRFWGLAVLAVLAVAVGLTSVPPLLRAILRALFRFARIPGAQGSTVGPLFGPRWLMGYVANWVIYALAFVLFVQGLGWSAGTPILASAFAAAYLMGYAAFFAPAGIGVREGVLIALLQPVVGDAAVAVALLARVWMTAVEVIPAGGFALWEVLRPTGENGGAHRGEAGGIGGEP